MHRLFHACWHDGDHTPDLMALVNTLATRFITKFASRRTIPSTTLTVAIVTDTSLSYVSVGDSPAFLISGDTVKLLTRDHTAIDRGRIISDFSALKAMGGSHILFNTIGPWPPRPIDYTPVAWGASSRLLICSDGLLEVLSQSELSLLNHGSLDQVVGKIRSRSTVLSPPDNYSAIIVALSDEEDAR
jgi:protein phosphatase